MRCADLLDVTADGKSSAEWSYEREPTRWLLVPMPPNLLRLLEWLDAEREDLEDGTEAEDDGIGGEASLGASGNLDQSQWAVGSYSHEPDREQDDADDREGDDEREPEIEEANVVYAATMDPVPETHERVMGKPHVHPTLGTFVPL